MEQVKRVADRGVQYVDDLKLADIETFWIIKAYEHHKRNIAATIHALGISRSTLYRRLDGIEREDRKSLPTGSQG